MVKKAFRYILVKTYFGHVGLVRTGKGIYSVILPARDRKSIEGFIEDRYAAARKTKSGFTKAVKNIKAYFAKKNADLRLKLDLDGLSRFDRDVYRVAATIPRGQTRSYGWIAEKLGDLKKSRAVGQSLAKNRLPVVIPCHRVVGRHDFGGFNLGVASKRMLLSLEGRLW